MPICKFYNFLLQATSKEMIHHCVLLIFIILSMMRSSFTFWQDNERVFNIPNKFCYLMMNINSNRQMCQSRKYKWGILSCCIMRIHENLFKCDVNHVHNKYMDILACFYFISYGLPSWLVCGILYVCTLYMPWLYWVKKTDMFKYNYCTCYLIQCKKRKFYKMRILSVMIKN